jgi:hypothetical protein
VLGAFCSGVSRSQFWQLALKEAWLTSLDLLHNQRGDLKMRYSPYVNKGFVYILVIQNIEFYSPTIYIFMILEYNKLSRDNNQVLQEHKMK